MDRRSLLTACGASACLLGMGPAALAQTPAPAAAALPAPTRLPELHIYIPGGAGGGWDQTGRTLGAAIQAAGLAERVTYENKGGKGGTIGLADFVARYDRDPAALLIGGMVMLGAIALGQSKATLKQVSPIARLTNDFMVMVSRTGQALDSMAALTTAMRANLGAVGFTGGSAGGVDHVLAGMIALQLRQDVTQLRYLPTSSGPEAAALLEKGEAQVAISGYSEFQADIEKKLLTPLAISSRRSLYGVPSLHEQGLQTDLSNWRAVFAPGGIGAAQRENLRRIVVAATQHPTWAQALEKNKWFNALLHGPDFASRLVIEQGMANAMAMMLKLRS